MNSFKEIINILDERSVRRVLILCHKNADPDAICSSYALLNLLRALKPDLEVIVAVPESVSKVSKIVLEKFPMSVTHEEPDFKAFDVAFMVDTNTPRQLGEWCERLCASSLPIIVIDHHAPHPETEKIVSLCICRENVSATCEVIYELFREAGVKPSREVAEVMLLGIAFDTRHFALAKQSTFKVISEIAEMGVDIQESLKILTVPMDISEKIARLKACKRMKTMRIQGWIIAFSHVGSFQASAARAIIDVGADVAIVGSEDKGELLISMRSSNEFYNKTGIHLGRDIAAPLGQILKGMGGGHTTSAGVNGKGDLETAFKFAAKILKEKIKGCQPQP
ncbi:MAG: bifunctional oligoribonuclease/PAP phosphatase NrnA [Candidatus Bathyarchaeia archaeon]